MRKILIVFVVVFFISSCASIVSGSMQNIKFRSTPPGAIVWVDGVSKGLTPLETKLERSSKDPKVKIELEGYKPYEVTLKRKVNGWFWGNILIGGIIGIAIDAGSGAMYKLTPEQIDAQLSQGVSFNNTKNDIYIGVVLEANENWEKIGNLEVK